MPNENETTATGSQTNKSGSVDLRRVGMPERPPTMREREGVAEAAMWRDIDKSRDEYHVLMVPKNTVPPGARLAECYETSREWVVVGAPWRGEDEADPRYHNCDTMGCGTLFHVVARIQKPQGHTESSSADALGGKDARHKSPVPDSS